MSSRTGMPAVIRRGMVQLDTPMLGTLIGLMALWCLPVLAGTPEYMKLNPSVGIGVEFKGKMNETGLFIASDIEPLARPRSPKLRGEITRWNDQEGVVEIFGQAIALDDKTDFTDSARGDLVSGKRAQISCRVDEETGAWIAKSISIANIKASDKIKGTITQMWVDGVAPDTLSIDGFLVILDEDTDLSMALLLKDKRQKRYFRQLSYTDANLLTKGHVLAQGKMGYRLQYRQYLQNEKQHDLSGNYDSDQTVTQVQLRGRWFGYINEDFRALADFRIRRNYLLASDLDLYNEDLEFQVRQAYVLWRNIADSGLAATIGRQKIKESREWLWDEYLEAVRFFAYGSDRFGLQAIYIDSANSLKKKFETWTDAHLALEYYPNEDNTLGIYWLRRWDSDDVRNREPVWWGARYRGRPLKSLRTWGDLALMRGTDKGRDLDAWAMDFGTTWFMPKFSLRPSLTISYAFGSGDEPGTTDVDGEFRQTGYQDNSTRFGGIKSVLYYGALLDPELSNLAIATLGGGVRPGENWSIEVFYHNYRQDWAEGDLRGSLVDPPARPNGVSSDIGWEIDAVLAARNIWGRVKVSWTLGVFHPGQAFAPRQETAILNKLNLIVEI